jgi:hypothetical protein
MMEQDLGHPREDSKREYYHKGSQLLKLDKSTFTKEGSAPRILFGRSGLASRMILARSSIETST